MRIPLISLALISAVLLCAPSLAQEKSTKQICITIDDLPRGGILHGEEHVYRINTALLSTLQAHRVPAIGFVNEAKCYDEDEELIPYQVQVLRSWVEAGMELGNHGFSHMDINSHPLQDYKADVLRGEFITRPLMEDAGKVYQYYRHPYLHRGDTEAKRTGLQSFLAEHEYTEAPVTIDNEEWVYNAAYERALDEGKTQVARKIGSAYVKYMMEMVAYYERQSEELFGRDISQILLIHDNSLNADYLDELLTALKKADYRFISLDEALQDDAYQSEDTFTGTAGITWIHRWAITRKVDKSFFTGEPACPKWVHEQARLRN